MTGTTVDKRAGRPIQTPKFDGRMILGASVWLATLTQAGSGRVGLLEIVFLLAPLLLVPMASDIVRWQESGETRAGRIAHALLPIGGVLAATSFWVDGRGAVLLAGAWVAACGLAAATAAWRLRLHAQRTADGVSRSLAFVFLAIGAVWLLLSRAGVRPFGYSPETVFLAALHFHFTGFVLPVMVSATTFGLRTSGRLANGVMRTLPRAVAAGVLIGLPMIAAGNVRALPPLVVAGALLIATASFVLAGLMLSLGPAIASRAARLLLAIAAVSLTLAMVLAATYAIGQAIHRPVMQIPTMTRLHGVLNAIGFGWCGLAGWRIVARGAART